MPIAKTYELGSRTVRRMGFGAMQLPGPGVWGPPRDRDEALRVLRRALELGVDHVDTAQYYGPDVANELIREALHPYPEELAIVSKVGGRRGEDRSWLPALTPAELRAGIDDNLRSLGVEQLHAVNLRLIEDDTFDFEAALGALVDAREAGKVRHIGLSNVGMEELDRAVELTEIACVQNHYNVLERLNQDVFEATGERGIAFVPFFPLGSAFGGGPALAGHPALREVAERHDATARQVALAWLLHAGDHVLLIPGTGSVAHLEENMAAAELELGAEDLAALDAIAGAREGVTG